MKIKICGITKLEETEYLNEANVDYAGFVFYEKSKRNISFNKANELMSNLKSSIKKVAVMVSPDVSFINEINDMDFDVFQIHKQLSIDVIKASNKKIWYAVNINDEDELKKNEEFLNTLSDNLIEKIEGIVVDAPQFGSGKTFDWQKSKRLKKAGTNSPPESILDKMLFVLAGGLNPGNVAEGISIFNPDVVDVSSGVEGTNGKEKELIDAFVNAVR